MSLFPLLLILAASPARAADVGDDAPVPPAELPVPAGDALAGKVVVVNFWATWCAPCKKELPLLDALHDALDPARAAVVAVNIDHSSPRAEKWLSRAGLDLPVAWDPEAVIVSRWDPPAMPTTYVIGADGKVAAVHVGELDAEGVEALRGEVEALAGEGG